MILTFSYWRLKFTLRGLLFLVAVTAAAALLVRVWRESEAQNRSLDHMREIAAALRTMETTSGEFPRTASARSTGRPAHSWRAMLAPFIRYSGTEYDYSREWNSLENQRLSRPHSDVFCWDLTPGPGRESSTNVLGIVGPGAAFDSERESLILSAGLEDLICAIEVRDSHVRWMQPADLDYRDFAKASAGGPRLGTSEEGFCVIFLDGSVWLLRGDTPRDLLVRLMTIDGASVHDRDVLLEKFRVP